MLMMDGATDGRNAPPVIVMNIIIYSNVVVVRNFYRVRIHKNEPSAMINVYIVEAIAVIVCLCPRKMVVI